MYEVVYLHSNDVTQVNTYRATQFWWDTSPEPYWYPDSGIYGIDGAQVAQTLLVGQAMWTPAIGLFFTKRDGDAAVHLHICETSLGQPDKTRCITSATVTAEQLKIYPQETQFRFPRPVYLQPGKRYALAPTTLSNHKVAMVSGNWFKHSGAFYYSTDNAYFMGDVLKDLMLTIYGADFDASRVVVPLQPITLSDGIADLDFLYDAITPNLCALDFEYQLNGMWYAERHVHQAPRQVRAQPRRRRVQDQNRGGDHHGAFALYCRQPH